MAKGKSKSFKTGGREREAAQNKIGRAWKSAAGKASAIDNLPGAARGGADSDRRKAVGDINNIMSLGKGNVGNDIAAVNRSGGSLRDIANQVQKERAAKAKSGGPKSSRSDAVKKAWATRKRNGPK